MREARFLAHLPGPTSRDEFERMSRSPGVNSFFSGIGGFDLAFERAGFDVKFQCEIDPFCNDVLSRHWPRAKRATDIQAVTATSLPSADVWVGGFPCQDVSVARGHLGRDGLKGKNSGLFYRFAELIEARLPRVVLIENVTGLLNSHGGRDFSVVLDRLAELGYGVAWRVFNTRYFGSPQSRPRVYICAWRGRADLASRVLHETGPFEQVEPERDAFLRPSKRAPKGVSVPEAAYCLAATSGRHTGTDWSRSYVAYEEAVRRLTPIECERLQGFDDNWTVPSSSERSIDVIDSLRYHALGNAVSVPVVRWIANRLRTLLSEPDARRSSKGVSTRLQAARLLDLHPAFRGADARIWGDQLELARLATSDGLIRWKSAGVSLGSIRVDAGMPASPRVPIRSDFGELIEPAVSDSRYYLSPNAAEGILRRVRNQNRRLFSGLAQSLERLSRLAKGAAKSA